MNNFLKYLIWFSVMLPIPFIFVRITLKVNFNNFVKPNVELIFALTI